MKKYLPFFIIFLLISTIPALVFALFPKAASNINSGDIPSFNQGASKQTNPEQEIQSENYLLRWQSQPESLKAGQPATIRLQVLSRISGSPWEGKPSAKLIGQSQLSSHGQRPIPLTVTASKQSGLFEVKITLPQAGPWRLRLTLSPGQSMDLNLYAQD